MKSLSILRGYTNEEFVQNRVYFGIMETVHR